MSERQPQFLRITTNKRPAFLYSPAVFKSMMVEKDSVYQVYLNSRELTSLLEGGQCEVATPGSFDHYYILVNSQQGDPAGFGWQKQAILEE